MKDQYLKFREEAEDYCQHEFCISLDELLHRPVDEYDVVNYTPEELVDEYALKWGLVRRTHW